MVPVVLPSPICRVPSLITVPALMFSGVLRSMLPEYADLR